MAYYETRVQETPAHLTIQHGPLRLGFARETGTLVELSDERTGVVAAIHEPSSAPVHWDVGGQDRRHAPERRTRYEGTTRHGDKARCTSHSFVSHSRSSQLRMVAECGDWEIHHVYSFGADALRVAYRFTLIYQGAGDDVLLRQARLTLPIRGLEGDDWIVEIPGAPVPPNLPLRRDGSDLFAHNLDTGIAQIGLVGIHNPPKNAGMMALASSQAHPVYATVRRIPTGVQLEHTIAMAARLSAGRGVCFDGLWLECFAETWDDALDTFQAWWPEAGLETPADPAEWGRRAAYYEVHVGTALFKDGFAYAPLPEASDAVQRLAAIRAMGYDVVQVMPRQPYPSYAVHDYRDVTRSWGDEAQLRELVEAAHSQGMRVILDLLLHGVLDQTVLDQTITSIREHHPEANGFTGLLAQYVRDFEPSWRRAAVPRHPLVEHHPDWFIKDEAGSIAYIYTHALDLANQQVQDYVIDALLFLVEQLHVDGFRFDAPTWNEFPNWDRDIGYPGSASILGAVDLFRRARRALKESHPDTLFYTEPSGPLFRVSMDVNYNYDEQWLIGAVLGPEKARTPGPWAATRRITARQMAEWFAQRQKALPRGSTTIHHIDSHDSFWWPDPGMKWHRERYGQKATSAMIAALGLIEGGFMTYIGGEQGQEAFLRRVLSLRKELPELVRGTCNYGAVRADDPMIFTPMRSDGCHQSVVAVNLADRHTAATLTIPRTHLDGQHRYTVYDALQEEFISSDTGGLQHATDDLERLHLTFDNYEARLLVLRAVPDATEPRGPRQT